MRPRCKPNRWTRGPDFWSWRRLERLPLAADVAVCSASGSPACRSRSARAAQDLQRVAEDADGFSGADLASLAREVRFSSREICLAARGAAPVLPACCALGCDASNPRCGCCCDQAWKRQVWNCEAGFVSEATTPPQSCKYRFSLSDREALLESAFPRVLGRVTCRSSEWMVTRDCFWTGSPRVLLAMTLREIPTQRSSRDLGFAVKPVRSGRIIQDWHACPGEASRCCCRCAGQALGLCRGYAMLRTWTGDGRSVVEGQEPRPTFGQPAGPGPGPAVRRSPHRHVVRFVL